MYELYLNHISWSKSLQTSWADTIKLTCAQMQCQCKKIQLE